MIEQTAARRQRNENTIFNRANGRCEYCAVKVPREPRGGWHIDHVTPLIQGGGHEAENLALSCSTCNLSKGARSPLEWLPPEGLICFINRRWSIITDIGV